MAHLVSMPPPADYHVPPMTFVAGSSGRNDQICAWGADVPGATWRVGTDKEGEVESFEIDSPTMAQRYPSLKLFELKGVRPGMRLALFISRSEKSFGQTVVSWQRASPYVVVVRDKASTQSKHNEHIWFYPPSDQSENWTEKFERAVGDLASNSIGAAVLSALSVDVTVRFGDSSAAAEKTTSGEINLWINLKSDGFKPGTGVDEFLLHELIHVVENWYNRYENRYNFQWDDTDFLTVNATNVYSCMRGRALRKDHGYEPLPSAHFRDPKLHWTEQRPNYIQTGKNIPSLVRALSQIKNFWNPFIYLT